MSQDRTIALQPGQQERNSVSEKQKQAKNNKKHGGSEHPRALSDGPGDSEYSGRAAPCQACGGNRGGQQVASPRKEAPVRLVVGSQADVETRGGAGLLMQRRL